MRLIEAFKAFWHVLTGTALVPRTRIDELEKALAELKNRPAAGDRFNEGAVYSLVLLQREGRLIDFLLEDIAGYDDGQIGAAVRSIHAGAAKVLRENFRIVPVRTEAEGSNLTISGKFDPQELRLTGNVPNQGPYKGTLAHRGWVCEEIRFPARNDSVNPRIVQAAEIQI